MSCPGCGAEVLDIDLRCSSCGAALGATGAHRLIGSTLLGHYELVDVLGQGGMSVVFRGRHQLSHQEVALKVLLPELAAHSQVKSRFVDEARTLAALDHPNIVHLYNFGPDNGSFVLAMQLVDGQTWERKILEAGRLDWAASCRIAVDVLRALEYAHGRGVIHRDMKPSNVLIRARDGLATVMDFGIARMTTSQRLTSTGQTMGTVRYMSPEQVRGQEADLRTDLYSLGATLYESLTGDTPFDGSTHFEVMSRHVSDAPRPLAALGVTVPAAVEEAVMRCLAKRPDDRFASAREMRVQLEAALRDADLGLVETQRLGRDVRGEDGTVTTAVALPTARVAGGHAGRRPATAGSTADDLAAAGLTRRRWPVLAIALVALVLLGGAGAAVMLLRAPAGYRATVEIAGVTLTRGAAIEQLRVETDGAIEPVELAHLYVATLAALRQYARSGPPAQPALEIADPIDVLLAVPARALCEPTAYLDRQPPGDCASALSATAIGARGTRRLMVVSDRAQLAQALRRGIAQATCDFSPAEDDQRLRQICEVTSRFAGSAN
jgi:tRNA A-37 threonylcarbamoyl transferase component Bud32